MTDLNWLGQRSCCCRHKRNNDKEEEGCVGHFLGVLEKERTDSSYLSIGLLSLLMPPRPPPCGWVAAEAAAAEFRGCCCRCLKQ